MRVLTPRVHVEVFRGLKQKDGNKKIDAGIMPNVMTYNRVVQIEDRRVKGIQFEETALFGGFIEINIAEDPASPAFNNFLPSDHIEVFYDDTNKGDNSTFMASHVPLSNKLSETPSDRNVAIPRFSGSSWKSNLKYTQGMVTTQLHAWDYLRLLQYINIPKGEGKGSKLTSIQTKRDGTNKHSLTKKKYGNDLLDYIDSAFTEFLSLSNVKSLYGRSDLKLDITSNTTGSSGHKLKYVEGRSPTSGLKMFVGAIGAHCQSRIESDSILNGFSPIKLDKGSPIDWKNQHNGGLGNAETTNVGTLVKDIREEINNIKTFEMKMWRFIDGNFSFVSSVSDTAIESDANHIKHFTADIVAIDQFALMNILLSKLTIDHGLNQWFTPLINLNPEFIKSIEKMSTTLGGRGNSKLVYIRTRKGRVVKDVALDKEPYMNFNIDTFSSITDAGMSTYRTVIADMSRMQELDYVKPAPPDILSLIMASTDFPQPAPTTTPESNSYSLVNLIDTVISNSGRTISTRSQKDLYDSLMEHFIADFPTSSASSGTQLQEELTAQIMDRTATYSRLMNGALTTDDKVVSFVTNIPASYMRADIYTGSKFLTLQYDSLAITRLIQILGSMMRGFPSTNNPQSNTERGKIDSYPIFAANRIVIKPMAWFGKLIDETTDPNRVRAGTNTLVEYEMFSSLASAMGTDNTSEVACFLIIDVGKQLLKEENDDPDFFIPMEDVSDFGVIKASVVNHFFNFSLGDIFSESHTFIITDENGNSLSTLEDRVIRNGLFMEYREAGSNVAGFSASEIQNITITDMMQNETYDPLRVRAVDNVNITGDAVNIPVVLPSLAFKKQFPPVSTNDFYVADFDNRVNVRVRRYEYPTYTELKVPGGTQVISPKLYHGVSKYIDITDLKNEIEILSKLFPDPNNVPEVSVDYRDVANVQMSMGENIWIKAPFTIEVDMTKKIDKRIILRAPPRNWTFTEVELWRYIKNLNEQLQKIEEQDMHWLFPYAGFRIDMVTGRENVLESSLNKGSDREVGNVFDNNLFVVTFLDLVVKGLRYLLWSMGKARMFSHIYVPIDYDGYSTRANLQSSTSYLDNRLVPGSSVKLNFKESNSLLKGTEAPFVAFPIKDMTENDAYPMYDVVSKGVSFRPTVSNPTTTTYHQRELTWYVSKKITYLGQDVGAMMRLEMTEGALDWTLFYNEENMLTQMSEHYLLNGLSRFRTEGAF